MVRWEWGTGELYNLEPLYFERHHFPRGRPLKAAPKGAKRDGAHEHGFDARGRLTVVRKYNSVDFYQSFYVHHPDRIDGFHYDYFDASPVAASRYELEQGRVVRIDKWAVAGRGVARFDYRAKRLVCVRSEDWSPSYGRSESRQELRYDARGQLEAIEDVDYEKRSLRWMRPRQGESLATLMPRLHRELLRSIERALARLSLDEPVYALCLFIDSAGYDQLLPPMLVVGLASEREAFRAKYGKRCADSVYGPVEWRLFDDERLALRGERLLALCQRVNQLLWEAEAYPAANELVLELARDLNGRALALETTDDFLAFTFDYPDDDSVAAVKRSAPPKLLEKLRPWLK